MKNILFILFALTLVFSASSQQVIEQAYNAKYDAGNNYLVYVDLKGCDSIAVVVATNDSANVWLTAAAGAYVNGKAVYGDTTAVANGKFAGAYNLSLSGLIAGFSWAQISKAMTTGTVGCPQAETIKFTVRVDATDSHVGTSSYLTLKVIKYLRPK